MKLSKQKSGDTRRVFEMFELINVMFPVMFIIVVGIIIFSLVQGIITWNKNNQSPRLTVPVVVVAKREKHYTSSTCKCRWFERCTRIPYYNKHFILCDISGGKWRQNRALRFWNRIWNACRRWYWQTDFSRNEIFVVWTINLKL